jgi:peptidoglycan/LPS O-acetylase OafA/YrhL
MTLSITTPRRAASLTQQSVSSDGNIVFDGAEHTRFLATKTFGSLDGLRAIAILAVVWHHAAGAVPGWRITSRGFLGVDLFFTISGFLIVTLLLRERRRTGTVSLRDFYIRRFLRIFPAYYLMLLVVGTAFVKFGGASAAGVKRDLPFAIFFLSNLTSKPGLLSITWSLSVEEQFYMLVPAAEKYVRRVLPYLLPFAYVLAALPSLGAFPTLRLPDFFRETTFGPILLGAMLAHVLDCRLGFSWVSRAFGGRLGSLAAVVLVVATAGYSGEYISGWPRIGVHWALMTLVASCAIRETNLLAPLLSLWPMRRIGVVSYGIYLYHLVVMHFVVKGLAAAGVRRGLVVFAGTILATWVVAEFSYRLLEVRFLKLKARFASSTDRSRLQSPERVGKFVEHGVNYQGNCLTE